MLLQIIDSSAIFSDGKKKNNFYYWKYFGEERGWCTRQRAGGLARDARHPGGPQQFPGGYAGKGFLQQRERTCTCSSNAHVYLSHYMRISELINF